MSHLAPRILSLLEAHVFVIGDVILDTYIEGKVSRISPEAPIPVVHETKRRSVLGGAANTAANIVAFGAQATLCGRVGVDADGQELKQLCQQLGIHSALVEEEDLPTIRKARVVAGWQQLLRIDREIVRPLKEKSEEKVIELLQKFLEEGKKQKKAVVLSDYGKGFLSPAFLSTVISLCKNVQVPVVVDPKSPDPSRYAGATLIKPDRNEARAVLRQKEPDYVPASPIEEAHKLLDTYREVSGAENVVLSLSEDGMMLGGEQLPEGKRRIASRAIQVADVSGAGDTVVAYLSLGLAAGLPLGLAAEMANLAAGIKCGKMGTAPVTFSELMGALGQFQAVMGAEAQPKGGTSQAAQRVEMRDVKVITQDEAKIIAERLRKEGQKIVFTNGCFDIVHVGHVDCLQQARALGDVLFVGLNSDASVQRLKGPTRPIVAEANRAKLLAGLTAVDYVVLFEEDTPLELVKKLHPDVMCKGGDYTQDQVAGASEVVSWGGSYYSIPLVEGQSTTSILEKASRRSREQ